MSLMSSLSIKAKILSLAVVSVIGFLISLTVNSNINSANSDRLQMIQKTFFPVVQDSKANLVRLEQIKELFSTAVSAGEMDFVNTAEKNQQAGHWQPRYAGAYLASEKRGNTGYP